MRGEALSLQCLAKDAWSTGRFPSVFLSFHAQSFGEGYLLFLARTFLLIRPFPSTNPAVFFHLCSGLARKQGLDMS